MLPYLLFTAACVGLVLGSFATAVAHRARENTSWYSLKGRSARSLCPQCGHVLAVRDLVPLISWITLKGRCRYCKSPIPKRYPLIELTTMLGVILAVLVYGPTFPAVCIALLVPFLVALAVVDLEVKRLPNPLVAIVAVLAIPFHYSSGVFLTPMMSLTWLEMIVGAALFGGISWVLERVMTKLLNKPSMGFGDVKFFAAAGLWLGAGQAGNFMLISGLGGVLISVLWKMYRGESNFPFGPALILSLYALLIITGYFS